MLVSRIELAISHYKKWLSNTSVHPCTYKWETHQHFKTHWNLQSDDALSMFDKALYNTTNRRLWQSENWQPKRVMLAFWQHDPLTVKMMFQDLFNEEKTLDGRIGRFLFGCDVLLEDYRRHHIGSIENNHYHDDYRMVSLYLGLHNPSKYAVYEFVVFQNSLQKLGAKNIPQQNDLSRYFTLLQTLAGFLDKHGATDLLLSNHLKQFDMQERPSAFAAEDFCHYIYHHC